ncbi:MAG: hypothetical protein CMJ32_01080 [Phycisphaerae bacterium]|nr:hypothetical protein [Phycisphaerae bacterium]
MSLLVAVTGAMSVLVASTMISNSLDAAFIIPPNLKKTKKPSMPAPFLIHSGQLPEEAIAYGITWKEYNQFMYLYQTWQMMGQQIPVTFKAWCTMNGVSNATLMAKMLFLFDLFESDMTSPPGDSTDPPILP